MTGGGDAGGEALIAAPDGGHAARRGAIALALLLAVLLGLVVLADRLGPAPEVPPYPRAPATEPDPVVGLSATGIERPADASAVNHEATRTPVAWIAARTAGDDRHVVLALDGVGGPPEATTGPSDPCADDFLVEVRDADEAVTVAVRRIDSRAAHERARRAATGWLCSAVGYGHSLAVELPSPLAGRATRDAADPDTDRPLLDTATVPLSQRLPDGCATTGSEFAMLTDDRWAVTQMITCDRERALIVLTATDHLEADTSTFFPPEWAQARRDADGVPVDVYEIPAGNPRHVAIARFPDAWVRVASNDLEVEVLMGIARSAEPARPPTAA